ncbi:MAG TPA: type III PLP-dependent enzyme [Polyangiaceae bacterium]
MSRESAWHPTSYADLDLAEPGNAHALVREHGSPLMVLDCHRVRAQYRRLAAALPGVDLYFAIKALPHLAVIATLDEEGSFFDFSTLGEVALLKTLGIPAERTIHTHPIKRERDIRESMNYGCTTFVVDNAAELDKFVEHAGRVSLFLRVGFRSADAQVDLAKKFGCAVEDALTLLRTARELGVAITGLTFHVGSQCGSPRAFVEAIHGCMELVDQAQHDGLADIRALDIGGGFPVAYAAEAPSPPSIEAFCAPICAALERVPPSIRVAAEPGRFLVAPAMNAIATVIGKARRGNAFWYYLDDGVYGSFNGRVYDPTVRYPLQPIAQNAGSHRASVLAGPTCDSIDVIAEDVRLPELQIGDLLVGTLMGAYTMGSASEFNSIPRTKVVVANGPSCPASDSGLYPSQDEAGPAARSTPPARPPS